MIFGAYYQSGQSCISVQRILVHKSLYSKFRKQFSDAVLKLRMGDPKDEKVFIGPMVDEEAAKRIDAWMDAAVAAGAKPIVRGKRRKNLVPAALFESVPRTSDLYRKEAFGPVALIEPFDDFEDAINGVNDSDFGLQAGVFTGSLAHTMRAWDALEVGGVIVGDVPSFRVDNMPYGGVKLSGLGREGVRSAIRDMTEERLLVVRDV
jgi:acyl-CoA reductase-like NAD-dependent aldehyde dehydrogenase